ncbi:hypothetical protein GCM10027346_42600 [Hymenobacter seoulensis]
MLGLGLQQCNPKKATIGQYVAPPEFAPAIRWHQRWQKLQQLDSNNALLPLPLLYQEDSARVGMNFRIEADTKALGLNKSDIVLRNPFSSKPFPLANSVIFQNHLVTLFEPGYFACYTLDNHTRNEDLERRLNTRNYEYHWLVGGQLIGLSHGKYYAFGAANAWVPYTGDVPFNKQPTLFEDERYLSFLTCHGEFGGEVYFYDKHQRRYYLTGATCPNSVFKQDGNYFVLSSLGHGMGSADLQKIADPAKLARWQGSQKPQDREFSPRAQALNTSDASASRTVFQYYGLEVFSAFYVRGHRYYMVHWQGRTFLATIAKNVITLVDPLFNDGLYTHYPVTINYGPNVVLMNLHFYGVAGEKEVACLLIAGNDLVKINWTDAKSFEALMMGQ